MLEKKNFLVCGSCFWCVSCLTTGSQCQIVICPSCCNTEMQLMAISNYESYGLDNDYINEMATKLWTSRGGGSIR